MKKKINILLATAMIASCLAVPFTARATDLSSEEVVISDMSVITEPEEATELFNKYFKENNIDAECITNETYPDYHSPLVVEYVLETGTINGKQIVEFAEKNNIERTLFRVVPIINGERVYKVNATVTATITEPEEAKELFNKYFKENNIDAECIINETYPDYHSPLVVEYVLETGTINGKQIVEFAEKNNIERTLFRVVPIINGERVYKVIADINVVGDTNCDGEVDMADAVLIMQALANPDKYGLDGTAENHMTEQGRLNGDMNGDGLTVGDAQAIQRQLLGLVETTNIATEENIKFTTKVQEVMDLTEQEIRTQDVLNRTDYVSSIDEIKNIYSAEEIIDYIDYCSGPNIITCLYLLNEKFPIEYFYKPNKSAPYCVYKVDSGDELIVFFNETDNSLRDVTYFFLVKDILTQESFSGITQGSTLADVEKIDAGTKFIDDVNANSLSQNYTLHIIENGFVKITYENGTFDWKASKVADPNKYIVKEVNFIPSGEPIDIPRVFGDSPVHFSASMLNK